MSFIILLVLRHLLELLGVAEHGQVLGEVALLEHVQPGLVQAVGEVDQGGVAVQLAPCFFQGAGPGGDGGQGLEESFPFWWRRSGR